MEKQISSGMVEVEVITLTEEIIADDSLHENTVSEGSILVAGNNELEMTSKLKPFNLSNGRTEDKEISSADDVMKETVSSGDLEKINTSSENNGAFIVVEQEVEINSEIEETDEQEISSVGPINDIAAEITIVDSSLPIKDQAVLDSENIDYSSENNCEDVMLDQEEQIDSTIEKMDEQTESYVKDAKNLSSTEIRLDSSDNKIHRVSEISDEMASNSPIMTSTLEKTIKIIISNEDEDNLISEELVENPQEIVNNIIPANQVIYMDSGIGENEIAEVEIVQITEKESSEPSEKDEKLILEVPTVITENNSGQDITLCTEMNDDSQNEVPADNFEKTDPGELIPGESEKLIQSQSNENIYNQGIDDEAKKNFQNDASPKIDEKTVPSQITSDQMEPAETNFVQSDSQKLLVDKKTNQDLSEDNILLNKQGENNNQQVSEENNDQQVSEEQTNDESKSESCSLNISDINLKKLQSPFNWIQTTDLALKFDESQELKIDLDEEPVLSIMTDIMIAYIRTVKEDFLGAEKKLEEIDDLWGNLDKEQLGAENISIDVLNHIIQVTKYYVYKNGDKDVKVEEVIKNIVDSINFIENDKDSSTIDGCIAIAWSTFHEAECIEAKFAARSAIRKNPDCALWHYVLAKNLRRERRRINFRAKPTSQEKDAINKCIELSDKDFYKLLYAQILRDEKNIEASNQIYMDIYNSNPASMNTRLRLALVFTRNGNLEEAKSCLDYGEKNCPENCMFLHYKGIFLERVEEDYEKAMEYFKKSAELNNFPADMSYAKCLIKLNKVPECIQHLHHMFKKYNDDFYNRQHILLHISMLNFQEKDFMKAVTHFLQAIEIDEESKQLQGFQNSLCDQKFYNIYEFIEKQLLEQFKLYMKDVKNSCEKLEKVCEGFLRPVKKSSKRSYESDSNGKCKKPLVENERFSNCDEEKGLLLNKQHQLSPQSRNPIMDIDAHRNLKSSHSTNENNWRPSNRRQRSPTPEKNISSSSNQGGWAPQKRQRQSYSPQKDNFSSSSNRSGWAPPKRHQRSFSPKDENSSSSSNHNDWTSGKQSFQSPASGDEKFSSFGNKREGNFDRSRPRARNDRNFSSNNDTNDRQFNQRENRNFSSSRRQADENKFDFRQPKTENFSSANNQSDWESTSRGSRSRSPVSRNNSTAVNRGGWKPANNRKRSPSPKTEKFSTNNRGGWGSNNMDSRSNSPKVENRASWESNNLESRSSTPKSENNTSTPVKCTWKPMHLRSPNRESFNSGNQGNWPPSNSNQMRTGFNGGRDRNAGNSYNQRDPRRSNRNNFSNNNNPSPPVENESWE